MGFENNYFKNTNNIFNLKLKPNQFTILTYLIRCANNKNTCYPSLNNIYEMCCVSKQTVVRTLKELATLGYISIEKDKHNIYFIHYDVIENTNAREKSVSCEEALNSTDDSVVQEYLKKNQITIEEVTHEQNETEIIANETGLETKHIEELLKIDNDIAKVTSAINYAKEHNPQNIIAYAKHTLKNGWYSNKTNNVSNSSNFANFTQRQYDYNKLEAQLLGWDSSDDDYEININQ